LGALLLRGGEERRDEGRGKGEGKERGGERRGGEGKGKGHEPPPQYLEEVYAYATRVYEPCWKNTSRVEKKALHDNAFSIRVVNTARLHWRRYTVRAVNTDSVYWL